MFIVPLAAAVAQSASLIISKVGLTRRRIAYHDYVTTVFMYLAILTWLLWPWLGHVSPALYSTTALAKLGLLIAVAFTWNGLFYRAVQHEKANVIESTGNLLPISTILLAWLIQPASFDPLIASAAAIGTLALFWAFWGKHGLTLNIGLIVAVGLMALENVLVSQLLQAHLLSPVSLYAIRTSVIFAVFYWQYRPSISRLKPSTHGFLILTAAIGGGAMLLQYYGLRDSGVYITSFVLVLAPVFSYFASVKLLHERISRRHILGVAALIAAVVYVTMKR